MSNSSEHVEAWVWVEEVKLDNLLPMLLFMPLIPKTSQSTTGAGLSQLPALLL